MMSEKQFFNNAAFCELLVLLPELCKRCSDAEDNGGGRDTPETATMHARYRDLCDLLNDAEAEIIADLLEVYGDIPGVCLHLELPSPEDGEFRCGLCNDIFDDAEKQLSPVCDCQACVDAGLTEPMQVCQSCFAEMARRQREKDLLRGIVSTLVGNVIRPRKPMSRKNENN